MRSSSRALAEVADRLVGVADRLVGVADRLGSARGARYSPGRDDGPPALALWRAQGGYSPAQERVMAAAFELFARRGVGGTSPQMIADAFGSPGRPSITQFRTKDEIVVAAAQSELARLEAAIDRAEGEPTPHRVRDTLVTAIVDLAVERCRMEGTLLSDPVITRFFATYPPHRAVMDRLYRIVIGDGSASGRLEAGG